MNHTPSYKARLVRSSSAQIRSSKNSGVPSRFAPLSPRFPIRA